MHLQLLLQNSKRLGRVSWLTSAPNACFFLILLIGHGISGVSAGIKWRPDPSELPEFGPEFKKVWDAYFANAPDKPVLWMGVISACVFHTGSLSICAMIPHDVSSLFGDATPVPPRKYFSVGGYTVSTIGSILHRHHLIITP